ncbi:MAG: DNA-binding transcriptional MerR regulator [Reinekea sp.]|jgi:DNA-binding transcriptional MerR regulator
MLEGECKLYSNYRVKVSLMKIGKLAKLSGCTVQAIRYYEKEGLISQPERTEGNFRIYDFEVLDKLAFIKNCRAIDLTLSETKHLISLQHLSCAPCEEVNEIIDNHLLDVESRIKDLQTLQEDLTKLRLKCDTARSPNKIRISLCLRFGFILAPNVLAFLDPQ